MSEENQDSLANLVGLEKTQDGSDSIDKFKTFVNKWGRILGIITAISIIILILIALFVRDPEYYRDSKREMKESKAKVDSIYRNQDSLNLEIQNIKKAQIMFYDIIAQTNESVQQNNKKIDNLRRYFNEKINSVDKYTISDLDSFFRTRYARYYQEGN